MSKSNGAPPALPTPPKQVQAAYRDGVRRHKNGESGNGLELATVDNARYFSRGGKPSAQWARKARRWWSRNERFLQAAKGTPAYAAAQLWGGSGGPAYWRKVANMADTNAATLNKAWRDNGHIPEPISKMSDGPQTVYREAVESGSGTDGALEAVRKAGYRLPEATPAELDKASGRTDGPDKGKIPDTTTTAGSGDSGGSGGSSGSKKYGAVSELPDNVKSELDEAGQRVWLKAYNQAIGSFSPDPEKARNVAWKAARKARGGSGGSGGSGVSKAGDGSTPGVALQGTIAKTDDEEQIVFGWFYVSKDADGTVKRDRSGEWAPIEEIEKAVYPYVLEVREHGNRHIMKGTGKLVESVVFTAEKLEKMGIPAGTVPEGWWGGFKIDDAAAWSEIKKGNLPEFSIAGSGMKKAVA